MKYVHLTLEVSSGFGIIWTGKLGNDTFCPYLS
jgi:hypothetical protein